MSSTELTIPPSRIANAAWRALDVAGKVTRPLFVDVENVPSEGPFLLVGNHQLFALQDVPYLVRGLQVLRGVHVRGMTDTFQFGIPLWRDWIVSAGGVPGTRENCAVLLAAGEPVLVFPGGGREVYKRRNERYQLLWGKRIGFARMAIAAGCPIVPFGAVGAEDRYHVFLDTEHPIAAPVRAAIRRVASRDDVGTLLVRGTGPLGIPGADRLYFRFGAPIQTTPWAGRADDPEALTECRDVVKSEIETHIEYLLALRDSDPHRGLLPRAVHAVRSPLPLQATTDGDRDE
jgi:1-acyl-sn-glycerol-3-phosphate acyltransferase